MTDATELYPKYTGRIINAYVEAVVQRASGDPVYDADRHAKALAAFDTLIARLAEADDMLDYMDDWCSTSELVIARGGDPTCHRVDTEVSGQRTRDRLWINTTDASGIRRETFRGALRDVMKEDGQ